PGGTITGCPKFRCMQIIAELEAAGRGAYTGSLGYLSGEGQLDLTILTRTMTLTGGALGFRAGAGIVADSDPQRELEETRAQARGLLRALGGAHGASGHRGGGVGERAPRRRALAARARLALRRRPVR